MKIKFWKYQGTGNDFVMIDNRDLSFQKTVDQIHLLCHRRFGIGADGLICVELDPEADFRMVYFNSDGKESTFCGNGGRCVVAFAVELGIITKGNKTRFLAKDGIHHAHWFGENIKLEMIDVNNVEELEPGFQLFTGSPHFVKIVLEVASIDVKWEGSVIRNSKQFYEEGINVNFVELRNDHIKVRTYERGVEDETLSCGTGVTAAALIAANHNIPSPISVQTLGGTLEVGFQKNSDQNFTDIYLSGPTALVYEGWVNV